MQYNINTPEIVYTTISGGGGGGGSGVDGTKVRIGANTGYEAQGEYAVAIGENAGVYTQGENAISIGQQAGLQLQGFYAVAMGFSAGNNNQGENTVAIGSYAGNVNQGYSAVAIGNYAGQNSQCNEAVAIGQNAGNDQQQEYAVAIGYNAGGYNQGTNAIAIGNQSGSNSQPANSIILNATGGSYTVNAQDSGFYVAPVRDAPTASPLYYNSETGEISYASSSRDTKTNIMNFTSETSDTSTIYNLVPKTFTYNSDPPDAPTQVGYIADEVSLFSSDFITSTGPLDINWNTIIVFLVEEMKKLKTENENLKQAYDALAVRVTALDGPD
jgi:hypothetical protein